MQTVYVGNTLVNDVMLGSQRMDDVFSLNSSYSIEYLVVAGGGGGGPVFGGTASGCGGGGGLLSGSLLVNPLTLYQVAVGNGGNGEGQNGFPSYLTGSNAYLYSFGGGGGGYPNNVGSNGGSGGGGGGTNRAGGTGVSGQGTNGSAATGNQGGSGGGLAAFSSITGTSTQYAVGGVGGSGVNGTANTGNGGTGWLGTQGGPYNGGTGGTGRVVVRYLGPQRALGGTVSTDGDYTIHQYTSVGTFTFYSN
jgi:hypothetical protein